MGNRIKEAIGRYEIRISKALENGKTQAEIAKLALADSMLELATYQGAQSKAFASGRINEEEAALLYQLLGREIPTVEHFNGLRPAERIVVLQTMGELMRR